ncbi:MAG: GDP-mannose 4,6-dehydratase [Hyphomicrobiales bacterium]|nr:GDP-mannose 4,6-dehydratase [Hyphomicrobiales bacterium]MDE2116214.1 GDP-mannose 4,6-dehydratase [Hyphomicrobiales bacterium]
MSQRILLTGGSGFVGRRMAGALEARFPDARRLAIYRDADSWHLDAWEASHTDLTDALAVDAMISRFKPTHVVHLAAQSSVGGSIQAGEATWNSNFIGTFNLARSLVRYGQPSVFLFASTVEVYGDSFRNGKVFENTAPMPSNPYSAAKLAAEWMLADILPQGCHLIITRSVNHSGPGQDTRFVLPSFAMQIAKIEASGKEGCLLVGNLDAERDFLHVDDVIDAYSKLIEIAPSLAPRILVNVASGKVWKIASLLKLLVGMSKLPLKIVQDPNRMRASDIPIAQVDFERLNILTGWVPKTSVNEMLVEILHSARKMHEKAS